MTKKQLLKELKIAEKEFSELLEFGSDRAYLTVDNRLALANAVSSGVYGVKALRLIAKLFLRLAEEGGRQ
jgi:hypothetical protein